MAERYCPKCGTDVEDVGGFCLLGHSLRVASVTSESLNDLKAEVSKVFEEALQKVDAVVAPVTGELPVVPPPPPPLPADLEAQTKTEMSRLWEGFEEELHAPSDPITAFAPSPRMDWGPDKTPKLGRRSRRFRPETA